MSTQNSEEPNFAFADYGLIEADRTGHIDNYYVRGEGLTAIIGLPAIGKAVPLPTQYWTTQWIHYGGFIVERKIPAAVKNHGMNAVMLGLK